MPKPEVIEDYYGTRIEVETAFKSNGGFVYVDRYPNEEFIRDGHQETMDRFTPDEARKLAKQLQEAAGEAER